MFPSSYQELRRFNWTEGEIFLVRGSKLHDAHGNPSKLLFVFVSWSLIPPKAKNTQFNDPWLLPANLPRFSTATWDFHVLSIRTSSPAHVSHNPGKYRPPTKISPEEHGSFGNMDALGGSSRSVSGLKPNTLARSDVSKSLHIETCSCCRRALWASRARACKAQKRPWLYILEAAFLSAPPLEPLGRLRPTAFWKIPYIGHVPKRNLLVSEVAFTWCEPRFRQKLAVRRQNGMACQLEVCSSYPCSRLSWNAPDTTMTSRPTLHLIYMLLQESKKVTYGRKIGIGRMKILPFVFRPYILLKIFQFTKLKHRALTIFALSLETGFMLTPLCYTLCRANYIRTKAKLTLQYILTYFFILKKVQGQGGQFGLVSRLRCNKVHEASRLAEEQTHWQVHRSHYLHREAESSGALAYQPSLSSA